MSDKERTLELLRTMTQALGVELNRTLYSVTEQKELLNRTKALLNELSTEMDKLK